MTGLAALGSLGAVTVQRAEAGEIVPDQPVETRKTVCTHCSVGCSVIARVQNGVTKVGQAGLQGLQRVG